MNDASALDSDSDSLNGDVGGMGDMASASSAAAAALSTLLDTPSPPPSLHHHSHPHHLSSNSSGGGGSHHFSHLHQQQQQQQQQQQFGINPHHVVSSNQVRLISWCNEWEKIVNNPFNVVFFFFY